MSIVRRLSCGLIVCLSMMIWAKSVVAETPSTAAPRPAVYEPLLPPGTILSVSSYVDRELAELTVEALRESDKLAELGRTRPELTALLEGLFFGVGALDQIEPCVQVVVARQEFAPGQARPALRLPAVAIVFVPRDPQGIKPAFVLGFVNALREANEAARRERRPRYVMSHTRRGAGSVTAGVIKARGDAPPGGWEHNLSPAIGFIGSRYIVSTSEELAVHLLEQAVAHPELRLAAGESRVDVGPVAGLRLACDQTVDAARWAARRTGEKLAPLTARVTAAVDRGYNTAQSLLARVPELTAQIPMPEIAGWCKRRLIAARSPD